MEGGCKVDLKLVYDGYAMGFQLGIDGLKIITAKGAKNAKKNESVRLVIGGGLAVGATKWDKSVTQFFGDRKLSRR